MYHGFQLTRLFEESFQHMFYQVFCIFDTFTSHASEEFTLNDCHLQQETQLLHCYNEYGVLFSE